MEANQERQGRDKPLRPTGRPKIPSALQRELLIECGHRCAVCGESFPLERAHIIPWCETHEHKLENLICLCANCHARADKDSEHWGPETLREYKRRPWILRRFSEVQAVDPVSTVRFHLAIDFEAFDSRQQLLLAHGLASFLGLAPGAVQIISVERGSVWVTVGLPPGATERLRKALSDRDSLLCAYLQPFEGAIHEGLSELQASNQSKSSSKTFSCKEVEETLFLFFDNELEEERLEPFRDHVGNCPDCTRQVNYTRNFLMLVRERCSRRKAPLHLVDRITSCLPSSVARAKERNGSI
jgi:mycothiol system anti-sigma-R factor